MTTALNLINIKPDKATVTSASASNSSEALSGAERDIHESDKDSQSSFANVLRSESTTEESSVQSPGTDNSESSAADSNEQQDSDLKEELTEAAEATTGTEQNAAQDDLLIAAQPSEDAASSDSEKAGKLLSGQHTELVKEATTSLRDNSRRANSNAQDSITSIDGTALAGTDRQLDTAQQLAASKAMGASLHPARGAESTAPVSTSSSLREIAGKALDNNSSFSQPASSTNPESIPAAGKTLPPPGKSLPAGFLMQAGNDQQAFNRMGEALTKATDPIDLSNSFLGKFDLDNDTALAGNIDKLLRNMVSGGSTTASESASAALPASSSDASSTPGTLTPLTGLDRAGQATRGPAASGTEAPLSYSISAQAGSAEFQQQLSGRIRWMGNMNLSSAELKLHPAELGSVEVRITTEDDQTRVSFITTNANAKEVIESTLPRLRELLGDSGLQLEQGDVTQREQSDDNNTSQTHGTRAQEGDDDASSEEQPIHLTRQSTSQIDHYV